LSLKSAAAAMSPTESSRSQEYAADLSIALDVAGGLIPCINRYAWRHTRYRLAHTRRYRFSADVGLALDESAAWLRATQTLCNPHAPSGDEERRPDEFNALKAALAGCCRVPY